MQHSQITSNAATILKDLVVYNEKAIQSKIIMRNQSGSVTLFAFSEGQVLREHKTPHHALLTVEEGECVFEMQGKKVRLTNNQALHIPPDTPHAVYTEKRFKMRLTILKSTKRRN